MPIEVSFQILKPKTKITIDLMEHLGNFGSLVNEIYSITEINTPIDRSEILVIDNNDFDNIDDVDTFLSIKFEHKRHAPAFLAWRHKHNEPMNAFEKFRTHFKGLFHEPRDFAQEFIEFNCVELKQVPEFVQECIDWEKVWETTLSKQFYAIKVYDEEVGEQINPIVSVYTYAIFQNQQGA